MKSTSHLDRVLRATAVFAAGLTLLAAGCRRGDATGSGDLVLSGNVEVTEAQLSFKMPGRVIERTVAEGDRITAGQPVARLDDAEQVHEVALRRAELAAAEALLAELRAGSRPQEIAAAEAGLRSTEAERERARLEFTRQKELLDKNAVSGREFEAAQAQLKMAEARAGESAERVKLIKEGPRQETIQQAEARRQQATATVALATTRLENTRLASPLAGVVLAHHIEPGEFVAAGTPVVSVAETARAWVRVYIDQADLGRIRHGQKVAVRTDTSPNHEYEGTVGFIASEAEFTPKTVQTARERVKLVFRVKVDVANPDDALKPGMPADVIIRK
ncbi:MAG: HlyD family efflux transporter periplasmic adaptor subunit [Opitutaceae bacterium]|nr:HlyD family efflux transporter periplasmic adaptor subunit [Opitutaceae bacterium]